MAIGMVVVAVFEHFDGGLRSRSRVLNFRELTKHDEEMPLDPAVEKKLASWVDGPRNVANFWSGAFLLNSKHSKEQYTKTYEMLALVCALMLSVTVSFYTSGNSDAHLHGIVCCLANCSLWMCTLMSAFFYVAFDACQSDAHVDLLIALYGRRLLRAPMLLFTVGAVMVFLEFILYFKFTIDAGLSCSLCLGGCGLILPLFFHAMHKMGWAITIVNKEVDIGTAHLEATPTLEDLKRAFSRYQFSKGDNLLALDRDEFLAFSTKGRTQVTSVQHAILAKIFDSHVEAELEKLGGFADPAAVLPANFGGLASETQKGTGTMLVASL
jgi:hypothetical protein